MKYKKTTLKNGLRIVTVPMPNSLTTTVLVLTETGSKYETKRINGISHFLEHMCFKGTEKRPTSRSISEELDGLGAKYNAFTSHEYTGYYAKVENRHFRKILDVVSDIYLNSTFPASEIEKERGVIVGEIEMYEDLPQRYVWDMFTDLLYGDQPAGWNIAGTRETIKTMKRRDFLKYKRSHYVASATVVVVAGKVNEKKAVSEVKDAFGSVSETEKYGKKKVKEIQQRPATILKYKDTSQTHLIVGFRSYDAYHKNNTVLKVLAGVLGGGMSSRLFRKIRDEMGAGYYVGADNDSLTDHGYFACFVGVDNKRVEEILKAMISELRLVRDEEVSEEELEKVKNYLIGNLYSGLETSDALATAYGGTAVIRKQLKTPEKIAKEVRKVTARQIQNVAQDIFRNDRLNMALIGPYKNKKRFTPILKI